jgi:hypothetical protein
MPLDDGLQVNRGALCAPNPNPMIHNEEMRTTAWTPYREAMRYRRLLMASMLLNFVLAAALLHCLR